MMSTEDMVGQRDIVSAEDIMNTEDIMSTENSKYMFDDLQLTPQSMFELEYEIPESRYVKPVYGKVTAKYNIVRNIMLGIIVAEAIALVIFSMDRDRIWNIAFLIILLFLVGITYVVAPILRKKNYKKLHAAGEDRIKYTFFRDHVHLKNPTVEADLMYSTAEFYAENADNLVIVFPFNRGVSVIKSKCSETQLDFLRSIVPVDHQKAIEKKSKRKCTVKIILLAISILVMVLDLAMHIRVSMIMNSYVHTTEYEYTTYSSFVDCVAAGTIEDVVIYEDLYLEYTFTGRGEDERYFTSYEGDMDACIDILERYGVNWEYAK